MQLTPQDIQRLYPPRLYLLETMEDNPAPNAQAEQPPSSPEPEAAQASANEAVEQTAQPAVPPATPAESAGRQATITWRPKPDARLSLLLSEAEFGNRELTELLKNIVKALDIPFAACGFGKIHGTIAEADLAEMPTRFGVVFGFKWLDHPDNPLLLSDKQVYQVPMLSDMTTDRQNKRIAWETLKGLLPALH